MEHTVRRLQDAEALGQLVGRSAAFVRAIDCLPAVARSDRTVLITGETGTGKELIARAIHYLSPRAKGPIVTVNCGSLPDTLLEGELFGHERGAFTGAHTSRRGLIAEADSGTLFLDEIDTMPPKAQVSLLRVLQEKLYRPVGSDVERSVDVRVLGASNESIDRLVDSGRFRSDLYYRLCIFSIRLPRLRDREDDIHLLAEHLVDKHSRSEGTRPRFSDGALAALDAHDWPGNVRELENAVIRGLHLRSGETIEPWDMFGVAPERTGPAEQVPDAFKQAKQQVIETFERQYLTRLLTAHCGNVTRAARTAGKERRDLGKLLKRYGLDPQRFRTC